MNNQVRSEVKRLDAYRRRLVDRRIALPFFSFQEVLDVSVVELQLATAELQAAKTEGREPSLDLPFLREAQEITHDHRQLEPDRSAGPALVPRMGDGAGRCDGGAPMLAFLDQMKLARIVVGHTPTTDRRIHTRFGGRVVTIDTGMLASYFMGNPSALEIAGDRLKAIYPDSEWRQS